MLIVLKATVVVAAIMLASAGLMALPVFVYRKLKGKR